MRNIYKHLINQGQVGKNKINNGKIYGGAMLSNPKIDKEKALISGIDSTPPKVAYQDSGGNIGEIQKKLKPLKYKL